VLQGESVTFERGRTIIFAPRLWSGVFGEVADE
jgi:hypothetical protein